MLEVHPPSHTPHSWRDFFIHIATIVVGLLIAVGLEQSVEWLHHRQQIAETRATLARERDRNARISAVLLEEFRRITPRLLDDVKVFQYLRAHPGAPRRDWPAEVSFASLSIYYLHSGWDTAQQSGILPLMPRREVQQYNDIYTRLADANQTYDLFGAALAKARRYRFRTPDPSALSPAQVDAELALLDDLLSAHFDHASVGGSLQRRFPDFRGPQRAELLTIVPSTASDADRQAMARLLKRIQAIKDENDE